MNELKSTLVWHFIGSILTAVLAPFALVQPAPVAAPDVIDQPAYVAVESILHQSSAIASPDATDIEIADFIVDQDQRRIRYALVDARDVVGEDGGHIVVPFDRLSWNEQRSAFECPVDASRLAAWPAFDDGNLSYLESSGLGMTMRRIFGDQGRLDQAEQPLGDEFTMFFSRRLPPMLNGVVQSVRVVETIHGSRYTAMCVAIESDSPETKSPDAAQKSGADHSRPDGDRADSESTITVLLAPPSALDEQALHLPVGSQVRFTSVKTFDARGRVVRVAQSVQVNGTTVTLRDGHGEPRWSSAARQPIPHYVLASHLTQGALLARDRQFGRIETTIIDANTGDLAFAVVSVGELIEIDQRRYPVPFALLTFAADRDLAADLPVSLLSRAPRLSPTGLDDLHNRRFVQRVLDYYGVSARQQSPPQTASQPHASFSGIPDRASAMRPHSCGSAYRARPGSSSALLCVRG